MAYFIPAPSAFSDAYLYAKMARSFFFFGDFLVHGDMSTGYPALYPLILSISYLFKDMTIVYFFMKVINSFNSSLIIFPIFLLAREFLDKKKSFMVTFLVSIIPSNLVFSNYIMAENLFYPLFMFTIYFVYKTFTENKLYYYFLSLIFIFLSILTKGNGIILLVVFLIMPFIIYFILKNKKLSKLTFIFPIFIFLFVLFSIFQDNLINVFGMYHKEAMQIFSLSYPWLSFVTKFLLSLSFVFLGSGIIFVLMSFFIGSRSYKIKVFTWIVSLTSFIIFVVAANHGIYSKYFFFSWLPNRPLGRYLDLILPLIFILGFIGFRYFEINYKKNRDKLLNLFWIFSPLAFYSCLLTFFPLFPVNNMSLTWLGGLKYITDYLFFGQKSFGIVYSYYSLFAFAFLLMGVLWFFYFLYRKNLLRLNKLYIYFVIFFFLVSISAYSVTYYNSSKYWYNGEQMQLGLWFNEYDKEVSTVLFDKRDCTNKIWKEKQDTLCEPSGSTTIIGFWMNDNIKIGDIDDLDGVDYVVSKHDLDLNIIKKINGIKIYKVNKNGNLG
jgi:hypothetical protein